MLKQLLLLTLALLSIQSACSPGCSKCVKKDSVDVCEICDLSRFYYLNDSGACEMNVQANCKIPSPSATSKLCVQCNDSHFFDELVQTCVVVPDSKKDANCSVYSLVADCLRCNQGHVVQNGSCVAPTNVIANCEWQITEEHCQVCQSGFQLNVARTTCLSFSTVNNCHQHQDFLCQRCKTNFTLAFNAEMLTKMTLASLQTSLTGEFDMAIALDSAKEDCVSKSIQHCEVYDSFGRCSLCATSYHVEPVKGNCVLSREPEIFKCQVYSNVSTCAECKFGFYLSANKCVERSIIKHCQKYTITSDGCDECHESYYSAGSSCQLRNTSANVNHCKEYEFKEDKCKTCHEPFILSTDKIKCFEPIKHCAVPINASSSGSLTCTACDIQTIPVMNVLVPPGIISCTMRDKPTCITYSADNSNVCATCLTNFYFLDPADTTCKPYTKKCKTYEVDKDNCATCYPDHYYDVSDVNNKLCKPYTVKNCLTFVPGEDKCATCPTDYYKDAVRFDCHPYTLVNCLTPDPNANICTGCNPNFYLVDTLTCAPEDLWECTTANGSNVCTACTLGFYLASGKCYPGTQTGCDTFTLNLDQCTTCKSGFYKSANRCHPYTVSNCQGVSNGGFNATLDECTGCLPGFHLDSNNKCQPIKIPKCVNADVAGTDCTLCAVGYYKDTKSCKLQYVPFCKVYTAEKNECTTCHIGYNLASTTSCVKVEITNCVTYTANGTTCETCQSGFQKNTGKTECIKTDHPGCSTYVNGQCTSHITAGYYLNGGKIYPLAQPYCKVPKTDTTGGCTTCVDGYVPTDNGGVMKCQKLAPVTHCALYNAASVCTNCKTGYFLQAGSPETCVTFTFTGKDKCLEFHLTLDKCTKCAATTYLSGTGTCVNVGATDLKTLNCGGNTSTTAGANEGCDICHLGGLKVSLTPSKFAVRNPPGVFSLKADGTINQLMEEFEYVATKPVRAPSTSVCLQLIAGAPTSDTIDTATKCHKCRNSKTHYLTGGTCTLRTVLNCGKFTANANTCIACPEGLDYNSSGASNNDCTEPKDVSTTNCKFTLNGGTKCYECNPNFLVDINATNACVSNTSLKGCRQFDSTSAAVCIECKDGWYKDTGTNTCRRPETCQLGKGGGSVEFCEFCLPGFKPNTSSKFICDRADVFDTCARYKNLPLGNTDSVCVECKDPTTIPVNFNVGGLYKHKCVSNPYEGIGHSYFKGTGINFTREQIDDNTGRISYLTAATIEEIVSPTNICLPMKVNNCQTYNFSADSFSPCIKCNNGYYLDSTGLTGQACLKGGISGCQEYTAIDNCASCEALWVITTGSKKYCTRYDPIPFCEVHSGNSAMCLVCASGYLLRNSQCHAQDHVNCKFYDFNNDSCFGCEEGYFLRDNRCHPYTNTNCLEYAHVEDTCNVCAKNFYLHEGNCYLNTSLHCSNMSRLGNVCISCNETFFLDPVSSLCLPNESTNCSVPDQESRGCLACEDDFFLYMGMCMPYLIQNCAVRDSEFDRCELCHPGYYLNSLGSCEQYTLTNCQIKDTNANQCHQCKAGFYMSQRSTCSPHTVKNCNVANNNKDECLSCLPGHYKNPANNCVSYTLTKNCALVDPSRDYCITCKVGYYMDFGECNAYTVRNCSLYKADADLCVTCKRGYFLLKRTCVPYTIRCEQYNSLANECVTCPEGYYLDESICYVNNGLFCKEMSPFRNGCKSCVDGFYLNNGQCRIREKSTNCKEVLESGDLCLSCFKSHYIAGGICIKYDKTNCETYDLKKDLCLGCKANEYWISHNVCEKYTITNCKVYSNTADRCTECNVGKWYLDAASGTCVKSTEVEECEVYSHTINACTKCVDNFYLVSGSECRRNPTGLFKCIQYKDENTCIKCDQEFYVDQNYCQKTKTTIANCTNYFGEGKCDECASNFFLLENACIEKVETTCATWADADNCLTCPANFVLKTNDTSKKVCEDSTLVSCVEAILGSPTNKCTKCADKKILVNSACQDPVSPLTGCKTYIKEGECSECDDGFTLTKSNNGCVSNYSLMASNCAYGEEKSSPVCRACMSGYHLDAARDCVSCGGNGCDVCDPYDLTKCLFCKAGYDHDGAHCSQTSSKTIAKVTSARLEDHFGSIDRVLVLVSSFIALMIFA